MLQNRCGFRWANYGHVVFKGEAVFGDHIFIGVRDSCLEIGKDSSFNDGLKIIANKSKIILGEKVRVGWGCTFIDSDLHPLIDMVRNKPIQKSAPIILGRGVWVGHDCIVAKGTKLAENITVSSGSVVKGRFGEPNTIIGGNPAVVIDKGYKRDDV